MNAILPNKFTLLYPQEAAIYYPQIESCCFTAAA